MNTSLLANMSVQKLRQVAAVKEKIEALQQAHQKQVSALEQEFARLIGGAKAAAPVAVVSAKAPAKAKVKVAAPTKKVAAKSGMSAEGRANIIAAQKARWAKIKSATAVKATSAVKPVQAAKPVQIVKPIQAVKPPQAAKAPQAAKPAKVAAVAKPSGSPKRKISAEGRARIIAGAKARWAKVRAAKAAKAA